MLEQCYHPNCNVSNWVELFNKHYKLEKRDFNERTLTDNNTFICVCKNSGTYGSLRICTDPDNNDDSALNTNRYIIQHKIIYVNHEHFIITCITFDNLHVYSLSSHKNVASVTWFKHSYLNGLQKAVNSVLPYISKYINDSVKWLANLYFISNWCWRRLISSYHYVTPISVYRYSMYLHI